MSEPVDPAAGAPAADSLDATVKRADASPVALTKGTLLSRYVVLSELGSGAMGVVFSAFDPELDRRVALKVLRFRRGSGLEREADRLRAEAQAMAKLAHPNVVAIYDVGITNGELFLAMELVAGGTLRKWLTERPRTVREIRDTFAEAGRGLAAAHRAGLVHRDFKPDNVLVGEDGRARVTDFGLAYDARASAEGAVLSGTPAFLAPELWTGQPADARSDQFAFCVALYEALFGQRPFPQRTLPELKEAILRCEVPDPPSGLRVPRALRRVVLRGLEKDPAARFPSMDALVAELSRRQVRPRTVFAGAALLVAGLVAGALGQRGRSEEATCLEGKAEWGRVWSDERASELDQAFAKSAVPYAPAALGGFRTSIGALTGRWSEVYDQVCRREGAARSETEHVRSLRRACLDRLRLQAETLVDRLEQGDPSVLEKATPAVTAAHASLEDCSRAPEGLLRVVAPPPAIAGEVEAERRALARVTGEVRAGRFPQSEAEVQARVTAAERLAFRPLQAEAEGLRAELAAGLGDAKGALAALERAFGAAVAGRNDELAAQLAIQAAVTSVDQAGDFEAGARWEGLASAATEAVGNPPPLAALLERARGIRAGRQRDFPRAAAHFARSLELQQSAPVTPLQRARILLSLGVTEGHLGRFAAARAHLDEALALATGALGEGHPQLGSYLNNLGILADEEGRLAEALRFTERAAELYSRAFPATHRDVLRVKTRRMVLLLDLQRPAEAKAIAEAVLSLEGVPPLVRAVSELSLGGAFLGLSDPVSARRFCGRARQTAKGLPQQRAVDAEGLLCEGNAELASRRAEAAIVLFEEALPLFAEDVGSTRHRSAANAGLSEAHLSLGHADEAVSHGELAVSVLGDRRSPGRPHFTRASLALAAALEKRDPPRAARIRAAAMDTAE